MDVTQEDYKIINLGGIDVYYMDSTDGGGFRFGPDYLRILPTLVPQRASRIFEWCTGPGFIAFNILAHGLCDTLCLADINPVAVAACQKTIAANNLQGRVSIYQSDCLDAIPASEKWDLVVSNPPHSPLKQRFVDWNPNTLIYKDVGWELHKRFYRDVRPHLNPDALLLIQENSVLSKVGDFAPMIEENGLRITHVSKLPDKEHPIYYIGSVLADAWAEKPENYVRMVDDGN